MITASIPISRSLNDTHWNCQRIIIIPDAALVDVLDEGRDCVTVGGGVERRADGRRVAVVVRGRVRQRVVVVVEMMVVGVMAVSEVSLETGVGVL